jgi:hypothetical protein
VTEADAIETMYARWSTQWAALQPSVPCTLGNEQGTSQSATPFAIVMLSGPIVPKQLTQGPIGQRRFERKGTLSVKLFGSIDKGDNQLALLIGSAKATIESQVIAGGVGPVYMGSGSTVAAKQGSFYTRTLLVPFTFYEVA